MIGFLEARPYYVIFYFFAIPFAAFLSNILGKGEGQLNPWCSFYAALIYLSVIPGVFAILLNLYHILFENTSIYDVNIMVQLVPILSMFLSLYIIKKNVEFSQIPGFGKITAFASSIAAIMVLLFILDKARILIFSYIPFVILFLIVAGIYLLVRYGYRFFIKK